MTTIGTETIDGETMLIKSFISQDEPSVCVEDFCGYTHLGHFPITFSADYFPRLGFARFSGAWWNAPDMPCDKEPTEEQVGEWARLHIVL